MTSTSTERPDVGPPGLKRRGLTALVLVVLAGCAAGTSSGTSDAAKPANAGTGAPPTASPTVGLSASKGGQILVDAAGMTLYVFDKDPAGSTTSACTGSCSAVWPALTVTGAPTAAPGLPGQLGAPAPGIRGGSPVTWNGRLLYRYSGDHAAGDTNGDGIGGVWHVAKPPAAPAPTTTPTGY